MEQDSSSSSEHHNNWIKIQDDLKKRLITEDDFPWELPSSSSSSTKEVLKYIGGVDISFSKEDPSIACGTLVVLELSSLTVVYDDFFVSKLQIPYVPGFLAFREVPILLKLIEKMKKDAHPFYPQLLMVDGNGLLHPRGFGLACHLGILSDLPTIGVGKNFTFCAVLISRKTRNHNWLSKLQSLSLLSRNFLELSELHHVEGLNCSEVRALIEAGDSAESIFLTGNSGRTLGVAARLAVGASKPIFISIGHRISLEMALKIVKMTSKNRVPEPIRQADIRSREYLRKNALVPPSP